MCLFSSDEKRLGPGAKAWGFDIHSHVHVFDNPFKCAVHRSFFFQCLGSQLFLPHFSLVMTSCVDVVVLSWALSGGEVQRWRQVPSKSLLGDVVTEEFLDSLPGEVEVFHGQKKLQRPLRTELSKFLVEGDEQHCLNFGLVKTQAYKKNECDLMLYVSLDGATAVRLRVLEVRFTFPKDHQPEKFSHAFAAMSKEFGCKSKDHTGRQLVDMMRQELPGCVMRRKIWRFFRNINGQDSPLAMRCVLVLNGSGGLMLRMDTHLFAMVDDASTAAQVMAAVRSIYNATF